jgi:uncharacterized protein (TIGR02117 family)
LWNTGSVHAAWSCPRPGAAPLLLVALLVGCATSGAGPGLPGPEALARTVWVVSHGWHIGLAMRRADVAAAWPELGDLEPTRFVEVGWGDGEFYPASRNTSGMALRAALFSRSSVLHVVGFDDPPDRFFGQAPVVEISVSASGLDALVSFVRQSYARDPEEGAARVQPGLYGRGWFYRARGQYHLFANSNTWAARALEAAGCAGPPCRALTADGVLDQARRCSGRS